MMRKIRENLQLKHSNKLNNWHREDCLQSRDNRGDVQGETYGGVTSVAPVLSCCDGEICPGSEELLELHFSINSTNCVLKMRQRQQEPVNQAVP